MNDYNAKLYEDYKVIKREVERGMLPLIVRNPAIDRATSDYALAQAEHYHADQNVGKNPQIPLRNANILDRYANLVMYEELKWSHPDKMSIVEYPIMSETQEEVRAEKHSLCDDIQYGDRRYAGRRKSHFNDEEGSPQVRKSRMANPTDPTINRVEENIDLYDALENAGLTDRQRQVLDLVYFDNLTQERAANILGITQQAVAKQESVALTKLREYMTKI